MCVDRWCFSSVATPYKGCCIISSVGAACTFVDVDGGASCIMPQSQTNDPGLCCSGKFATDGINCSGIQVFD
jgi:hypothetical protein